MNKAEAIDSIIEMISHLENILGDVKSNLIEYNSLEDDESKEQFEFPFEQILNLSNEFRNLKRGLKRINKRSHRSGGHHFSFDLGDFDFPFDFEHLGESIERTVRSAVKGLENLDSMFDFEGFSEFGGHRRERKPRSKIDPGLNIKFGKEDYTEDEVLPSIDDISHGQRTLEVLKQGIYSDEDISSNLGVPKEELSETLKLLNEKGLVLQEKSGRQRYMLTRRGNKLLQLVNKKEETNN